MQQNPSLTYWQARGREVVDAVGAVLRWAQQTRGYQCTEGCVAELLSLRSYLDGLNGYDRRLPADRQRTDQPCKHHDFALWSLGDIQRGAGA